MGTQPVGAAVGDPEEGLGSNNWVIAGSRSTTGKPMVASDPHIAFAAVSCWYEVTLAGGSFNVTGMAYAGMPAVMFGRNERVAWGITNNICSQRDLYQERTDPAHPGAFLYDGQWEPARERVEAIKVRGGDTVRKTIRASRNGPIVDELLPARARANGPVSLRWLGTTYCGWLTSFAGDGSSRNGWRAAGGGAGLARADVEPGAGGRRGDTSGTRLPARFRSAAWRNGGYRPGWDPAHQWQGLIPWEGMPRLSDPERGWIASANNRTAPDDFPYPLFGRWASGYRARRVRQLLEAQAKHSRDDFARMHQDVLSLRAVGLYAGTVAGACRERLTAYPRRGGSGAPGSVGLPDGDGPHWGNDLRRVLRPLEPARGRGAVPGGDGGRSSPGPWPAWPRRSWQAMRAAGLRTASVEAAIVAAMAGGAGRTDRAASVRT